MGPVPKRQVYCCARVFVERVHLSLCVMLLLYVFCIVVVNVIVITIFPLFDSMGLMFQ